MVWWQGPQTTRSCGAVSPSTPPTPAVFVPVVWRDQRFRGPGAPGCRRCSRRVHSGPPAAERPAVFGGPGPGRAGNRSGSPVAAVRGVFRRRTVRPAVSCLGGRCRSRVLGDRLVRLTDNPNPPLTELPVELPPLLRFDDDPRSPCPPRSWGNLTVCESSHLDCSAPDSGVRDRMCCSLQCASSSVGGDE